MSPLNGSWPCASFAFVPRWRTSWSKRVLVVKSEATEISMLLKSTWLTLYSQNSGIWWVINQVAAWMPHDLQQKNILITQARHIHTTLGINVVIHSLISLANTIHAISSQHSCRLVSSPLVYSNWQAWLLRLLSVIWLVLSLTFNFPSSHLHSPILKQSLSIHPSPPSFCFLHVD